jgi:hypothetical protein
VIGIDRSAEIVDWLVKQDVATVKVWLVEVWAGTKQVPPDFSWPNLAAALNISARAGNGPRAYERPDLEWGQVAISVYSYAQNKVDPLDRPLLEASMMYLRAYLITFYGDVAGDPVLDLHQIIDWFFECLHLSLDEAEAEIAHLPALDIYELGRLRDIKTRLSILRFLADRELFSPNDELERWFALQQKLP